MNLILKNHVSNHTNCMLWWSFDQYICGFPTTLYQPLNFVVGFCEQEARPLSLCCPGIAVTQISEYHVSFEAFAGQQ